MRQSNLDEEVFNLYGKFLIEFEHVNGVLETAICWLIFPEGEKIHRKKIEILLEGLTADPLRTKFFALAKEFYSGNKPALHLSKEIYQNFGKLIPIRNSFAHGKAIIGLVKSIPYSESGHVLIRHPKIRSNGLDTNFQQLNAQHLKALISLAEGLSLGIASLFVCIMKGTTNTSANLFEKHMDHIKAQSERYSKLHVKYFADEFLKP